MSGKVFRKPGVGGFLVVGYSKLANFRTKQQAFAYAAKLDEPRLSDLERSLPGWVEVVE